MLFRFDGVKTFTDAMTLQLTELMSHLLLGHFEVVELGAQEAAMAHFVISFKFDVIRGVVGVGCFACGCLEKKRKTKYVMNMIVNRAFGYMYLIMVHSLYKRKMQIIRFIMKLRFLIFYVVLSIC